ncbi:hypothetical protein AWENTII_006886 [Aspergillus wentii]
MPQLMIRTQGGAPNLGGYPGSADGTVLKIAKDAGASTGQNLPAPLIYPPMYSARVDVDSAVGADEYKKQYEQAWLQGKDEEGEELPPASFAVRDIDDD